MTDWGMEQEAMDMERLEADFMQADMERQGRAAGKIWQRVEKHIANGEWAEAAATCRHGGGYPLNSLAAKHENDPKIGQPGVRCSDCQAVISNFPWDDDGYFTILEIGPKEKG